MSDINDRIRETVENNKVVLFMKGSKSFPQCGFSAAVADVLGRLEVEYTDVNVLADGELREGIKTYSNWPTIPQLYIGGEFVGGCDITLEMAQKGELQQKLGIKPAAQG